MKLATELATNKKPIVYIAGKVTGLPYHEVQQKFKQAADELKQQGYCTLSPLDFIAGDADWKEAMRLAFPLLCMADRVYLLPDWMQSAGAVWEYETAVRLGIDIFTECKPLLH